MAKKSSRQISNRQRPAGNKLITVTSSGRLNAKAAVKAASAQRSKKPATARKAKPASTTKTSVDEPFVFPVALPENPVPATAETRKTRKLFLQFCKEYGLSVVEDMVAPENWYLNEWVTMLLAVDFSHVDNDGRFVNDIRYLFRPFNAINFATMSGPEAYSHNDYQDCFCFLYDPGLGIEAAFAIGRPVRFELFLEDSNTYKFSPYGHGNWITDLPAKFRDYVRNGGQFASSAVSPEMSSRRALLQ